MVDRLYHATDVRNLPTIWKEGLVGQGTVTFDGRPAGPPSVHLSDSLDVACFVAGLYDIEWLVVLHIDPAGLELRPGWDGAGTYVVQDRIPATNIVEVTLHHVT